MCAVLRRRDVCYYLFFFKQKTAYEMRISDWSSDVCSSDLHLARGFDQRFHPQRFGALAVRAARGAELECAHAALAHVGEAVECSDGAGGHAVARHPRIDQGVAEGVGEGVGEQAGQAVEAVRSAEHTSELQSLMRISYAVFCLKKKNDKHTKTDPRETKT